MAASLFQDLAQAVGYVQEVLRYFHLILRTCQTEKGWLRVV